MKLYLDPGHGGNDRGAVGNGLQEKEIVLDLSLKIKDMLRSYPNAKVKLSRDRDEKKSLIARTNEANDWGADIFLSLHCNAFNGKARGYEDFIYNNLPANAAARNHQAVLHQKVSSAIDLPNRGQKQANFHVLRESNMPAILTENGFIDHPEDAKLMKQESWRKKVAAAHVEGLVEIFKLKKSARNISNNSYTVIAGSFKDHNNASNRSRFLAAHHISASVEKVRIDGRVMYRVYAGTFSGRRDAESQLKHLASIGVEGFISMKQ